jgi:hypothetical protein
MRVSDERRLESLFYDSDDDFRAFEGLPPLPNLNQAIHARPTLVPHTQSQAVHPVSQPVTPGGIPSFLPIASHGLDPGRQEAQGQLKGAGLLHHFHFFIMGAAPQRHQQRQQQQQQQQQQQR